MRDYFAAKAMAAIIGKIPLVKRTEYTDGKAVGASENEIKSVISGVSVSAYEYADAMLAAREAGYALDDGCEPVEVEAALASRDAEIERLRHALELAVPVMDAHAGQSRLAEFVSAGRTAQAARRSVVDWAKQAGFDPGTPAVVDWLSRFATIVDSAVRSEAMAAEREACAKVCDKEAVRIVIDSPEERAYNNAVSDCAAAIRARGEK